MQANEVKEKTSGRADHRRKIPVSVNEIHSHRCPGCSALVQGDEIFCPGCGRSLKPRPANLISLKEALLFGAILVLIALAIAPVWPKEQIYGKSIHLLVNLGANLPSTRGEAAAFRQQMMNIVQLYQGINVLHNITLSVFGLLLGLHAIQARKYNLGFSNKVWVILGLLLLVFPAVNLIVAWSMFLTPGVLGTVAASIMVILAGVA
jgi:hypothetical protein